MFTRRSFPFALAVFALAALSRAQCPAVPTALSAEAGVCKIRVSWSPSIVFAVNQILLRSTTDDVSTATPLAILPLSTSTFDDLLFVRGTRYYYWVRAVPAIGSCTPPTTASVSATVLAGAPFPLIAVGCESITVTCPPVHDAQSYMFTRIDINGANRIDFGPFTSNVFSDDSTVPGKHYAYAATPVSTCGSYPSINFFDVFGAGEPLVSPPTAAIVVNIGQALALTASSNSEAQTTFTWLKEGTPIVGSARIVGQGTRTLFIQDVVPEDAGAYAFRAQNSCGTATTQPFAVAVRAGCRADFDLSGALGPADIFEFLNHWFAGCP